MSNSVLQQLMDDMNTSRALLYFNTIKYLKLSQTAGRVYSIIKEKFPVNSYDAAAPKENCGLGGKVPFIQYDAWNCRDGILNGVFTFLNAAKHFPLNKIDWECKDMPLLWRFNLHYFNYLHLLNNSEKSGICANWIINNPVGKTPGWHPYPLSLRIVNWCKAGINDAQFSRSLYEQASYLFRHLETYHPGNHLLENARALVFAGVFFSGQNKAGKWLEKGLSILGRELKIQVLDDGGYFERSIMYHSLMLECVLDIVNILPESKKVLKQDLINTANGMGSFLLSFTHPDGKIALFNDSTIEIAPPVNELLSYLHELTGYTPEVKYNFAETGYYAYRNSDIYMAIDGGPIGPDYLPAHSHADIFSYELSLYSQRVIVDSGVYEYPAGEMRSYVRSTRAHNTVTIDDQDQAECWNSFRVARRYPPAGVEYEKHGDDFRFQGSFNGYASLIGDNLMHRRRITHSDAERTITVDDFVSGKGKHSVKSYIHFHPDIKIQFADNMVYLTFKDKMIKLLVSSGQYYIEKGWYCARFGEKVSNNVLVIKEAELPARLIYKIFY